MSYKGFDISGKVVRNLKGTKEAGLNRVQWDLRADPPPRPAGPPQGPPGGAAGGGVGEGGRFGSFLGAPVEPGVYLVKLSAGGKELTTRVRVEEDVWKNQ